MDRALSFISLGALALDPASPIPLYRQLSESLRRAVLTGRVASGTRVPSSRTLADALKVSRTTVVSAYEALRLEGYFEGHVGAGTYVAHTPPHRGRLLGGYEQRAKPGEASNVRRLSNRGRKLYDVWRIIGRDQYRSNAFRPGLPALDAFPVSTWSRLTARRWRDMPPELLAYGDPAGYRPLREVIASYVHETRGVRCEADQVIIVSGAPQAIALASAVLLDRGDAVWVEDPGSPRARGVLTAADAQIIPVPLDDEGLNLQAGLLRHPGARMVYVTPSHQYPLGTQMSWARRHALLEWATRTGAWILEDDYGTESRASDPPMAALQGLDQAGCVIYFGTFSQVLFPALSLGYLIVPPSLVDAFIAARILTDRCPPLFGQVVLADFIAEGHLETHIRHVRSLYEARRTALVDAIGQELGGYLDVRSDEGGLHLVVWLPPGADDAALSRRIAEFDIEAPPLSFYALDPLQRGGFVLGYAAVDEQTIQIGVQRMRNVLDPVSVPSL